MQYHLGIRRLDQAEGGMPRTKPLQWRVDETPFWLVGSFLLRRRIVRNIGERRQKLMLCRALNETRDGGCEARLGNFQPCDVACCFNLNEVS